MSVPLAPELYYLSNFRTALAWVAERYADLLSDEERAFLDTFNTLAWPSQALLVRMVMRKGCHFRLSKLVYSEIGDCLTAAAPLLELGWITEQALLTVDEITELLRKDEVLAYLPVTDRRAAQKKAELREQLRAMELSAQTFRDWCPGLDDQLLSLMVGELCDRLRLMFFGNLAQDWSEFVLADLGIYRYESVDIGPESRGFSAARTLRITCTCASYASALSKARIWRTSCRRCWRSAQATPICATANRGCCFRSLSNWRKAVSWRRPCCSIRQAIMVKPAGGRFACWNSWDGIARPMIRHRPLARHRAVMKKVSAWNGPSPACGASSACR